MAVLAFRQGQLGAALVEGLSELSGSGAQVTPQTVQSGPPVRRKEWHLPEAPLATSLIRDE
jgi:hypothetical protein